MIFTTLTIIKLLSVLAAITGIYFVLKRIFKTFRDLSTKRYPNFVQKDVKVCELGIPVFAYHSVANRTTPDSVKLDEFMRHMGYLSCNGYYTLSADELHGHLVYGNSIPKKSVVITFDDGRATLWTVAYPILEKFNFRSVSFIAPSTISESGVRPNLRDYQAGKPFDQ